MNVTKEKERYLMGEDLTRPNREDFETVYVYHRGEVLGVFNSEDYYRNKDVIEANLRNNGFHQLAADIHGVNLYREMKNLLKRSNITVEVYLDEEELRLKRSEYNITISDRLEEWKSELYDHYGVSNSDKADKAFDMAWEQGHSSGFISVEEIFGDLVPLIV